MIKFERLPANIIERISMAKKVLLDDDNIMFAYIFGGVAGGKGAPLSDIDIAIYLRNITNLAAYKIALFERLADALDTSELDLVILNSSPISLTGRILQNRVILADKEPLIRHAYESLTLREFFDFKVKENTIFFQRYGIDG